MYQVTESRLLTTSQILYTIFIEGVTDLATLPEYIQENAAVGSVAYTMAPMAIYHKDSEGWKDGTGAVIA